MYKITSVDKTNPIGKLIDEYASQEYYHGLIQGMSIGLLVAAILIVAIPPSKHK